MVTKEEGQRNARMRVACARALDLVLVEQIETQASDLLGCALPIARQDQTRFFGCRMYFW